MSSSTSSIAELPFIDDLLEVAIKDLDASRTLLQRLLSIADALLATTLTVAGLFAGFAVSDDSPALALFATPLVLCLAYLDGANWVHFRRVSHRIRSLERLLHSYVVALRETKTARPQAVEYLSDEVDRYQFGIERTFVSPGLDDIWRTNRGRVRWWFYFGIAVILVFAAVVSTG